MCPSEDDGMAKTAASLLVVGNALGGAAWQCFSWSPSAPPLSFVASVSCPLSLGISSGLG